MKNYEVMVEIISRCSGPGRARKDFREVEAESPEHYAAANSPYPVMDTAHTPEGDYIISTGDGKGSMIRFTFSEPF